MSDYLPEPICCKRCHTQEHAIIQPYSLCIDCFGLFNARGYLDRVMQQRTAWETAVDDFIREAAIAQA